MTLHMIAPKETGPGNTEGRGQNRGQETGQPVQLAP
jgi:hypothetical protein